MNQKTIVFKSRTNELLTLPILNQSYITSSLVSTWNLEFSVEEIYIVPTDLSISEACKYMLLPWTTKNISHQILKTLVAKTISLICAINNQGFFDAWNKAYKTGYKDGARVKVTLTEKNTIIVPQDTNITFDLARFQKPRCLIQDVLNNMSKIIRQEVVSSKQRIIQIQLGQPLESSRD